MKTVYTNLYSITILQQKIMRYIDYWVHTEKTPISQKRIILEMESTEENRRTVIHAIYGLEKQGYIRKAVGMGTGEGGTGDERVKYVHLRGL
jgi:hypothetical protein